VADALIKLEHLAKNYVAGHKTGVGILYASGDAGLTETFARRGSPDRPARISRQACEDFPTDLRGFPDRVVPEIFTDRAVEPSARGHR
jgi:hypothetical protein